MVNLRKETEEAFLKAFSGKNVHQLYLHRPDPILADSINISLKEKIKHYDDYLQLFIRSCANDIGEYGTAADDRLRAEMLTALICLRDFNDIFGDESTDKAL